MSIGNPMALSLLIKMETVISIGHLPVRNAERKESIPKNVS